jgi:hypothetical protein
VYDYTSGVVKVSRLFILLGCRSVNTKYARVPECPAVDSATLYREDQVGSRRCCSSNAMTCRAAVMDDDPRFRFSRPGGGGSGWRSHASWRTSAVLCNQILEWCTFNENENAVDPALHCASRDNHDQSRPIAKPFDGDCASAALSD